MDTKECVMPQDGQGIPVTVFKIHIPKGRSAFSIKREARNTVINIIAATADLFRF